MSRSNTILRLFSVFLVLVLIAGACGDEAAEPAADEATESAAADDAPEPAADEAAEPAADEAC